MGTVIYEASPFQTLLGALGPAVLLAGLGVVGIAAAVLRRRQRRSLRAVSFAAGAFLIVAAVALGVLSLRSYLGGASTVTLRFDSKAVASQDCGENGQTCDHYLLSSTTPANAYAFDVPQAAYDQAELNVCYRITYYAPQGLFSQASGPDTFQTIDKVTRIETADPSACP